MAERIDELQLLIGSDASSAIRQLGNLAGALDNAAVSARKLSSATGFANHFVGALSKLSNINLDRTINNLERLSHLNLNNLKDKTVTIDLKVRGADESERAKYAARDAANEIEKSYSQIAKTLGQKFNVDAAGVRQLGVAARDMIRDFGNGGNGANAQEEMFGIIAARGKESEAAIMGLEREYKEFVKEMNSTKINTSGITSAAERENAITGGMLSNLRANAIGIDQIWEEIMGKFPNLFDSFERAAANPSDQLDILTRKLQEARELIKPHEIIDDSTLDSVGVSIQDAATKAYDSFEESKERFMRESMDKIPIDLQIDQNRFETQIQDAITKATGKTYSTQPIKLKLDNQQLRDSVEAAFSLIDIAKLPQFADGFDKVSQSISSMNQTNLKDTGINQFTNAIRRLVSTDTSKFDTGAFKSIVDTIKDLAAVGDIGKGLNSFVSSIARLANAGAKTSETADGMKKLTPELKSAVETFGKLDAIDSTVTSFVASVAKLAAAGDKARTTAENLGTLTSAVMDFLNALSGAPEINENIANTIQGLGNLAAAGSNAGKAMNTALNGGGGSGNGFASMAVNTAINTTVTSFRKILSVSLQLGKQGASALGNFLAKMRLIPSQATSIDRTALTFSNLLRSVLPFYGLRGIFSWAKEAFEAGSSIVELENVIDTSFGSIKKDYEDISGYIYKWAQGTIDAFGVSQIAAEKYAGRLMAMFNSSGFDVTEGMRDSAAKMTTELIERAGDIASFYDIPVDEAMTKVQAGLAGMNRPLRSLGVNMTVANLQSYAMSQGINTAWKEMDQATQMALRYSYILDATKYAEGDFGRTSMSAANQVRLLTLNFQQLSAVMGQGIVSAIAPVLAWLNALIKRLIQAANAFRTFMWTLFGKPLQAARGVSDDTATYLDSAADAADGLGDAAGGASDGLGSAGKAAKDLKKQLQVLPFDELNQLAKDTQSAGSGGSSGGGGGGGVGGLGLTDTDLLPTGDFDLSGSKTVDAINKWAAKIKAAFNDKDWVRLGKVIADGLNDGFRELNRWLDWGNWKSRVEGFIKPFQTTVNSMMSNLNWKLIGNTIAKGLNTITYTIYMWITGFEWRKYGEDLATGMNSMLSALDAEAIGRTIASKFKAAWDFFGGWVSTFDFSKFGKKLKDGVLGAIDELDWGGMGESLADLFNGISDTIIAFLEDGQVASEIGEAFVTFVNSFIKKFDGEKAKKAMGTVKETIKTALSDAISNIDKDGLADDFTSLLSGLPWGSIGVLIGIKVGADLAAGIFGTVFKAAALKAIMGIGGGTTVGVSAAGAAASGGSAAASAASAAGASALSTLSVGTIAVGGSIMMGTLGLGVALRKLAESKGATPETYRGQNMAPSYMNGSIQAKSAPSAPEVSTPQKQITTSVALKAVTDPTFINALKNVKDLKADPIVTKILESQKSKGYITDERDYFGWTDETATKKINARKTNAYNTIVSEWSKWVSETIIKHANAQRTNAYTGIRSEYLKWVGETITKMTNAQKTKAYNTVNYDYVHWLSNTATKTVEGEQTQSFKDALKNYDHVANKYVKISIEADVYSDVKRIMGKHANGASEKLFEVLYEYNASGGLFNSPAAFQVFGEAGAEAAIPLERKSTMKRIASAIVDSGGMGNSSDAVADAVAKRILPALSQMIDGGNNRPINVNATLYTENDEVLARAVTRGQRSIDKRYNPVSNFSY